MLLLHANWQLWLTDELIYIQHVVRVWYEPPAWFGAEIDYVAYWL